MKVLYKCRCMIAEGFFKVRNRREGEDVLDWFKSAVEPELFKDHRKRSAFCAATKCEYVKIPVPSAAEGIGFEPTLN